MSSEPTRVVAKIDDATRDELKIKAIREGLTLSEVIRRFLFGWLSGEVTPPPPPPTDKTVGPHSG